MQLTLRPRELRELKLPLAAPLPAAGRELELVFRPSAGSETRTRITAPPMLDIRPLGGLDWKTVPFDRLSPQIVLDERNQIQPPDPFISWRGPEDLSARLFLAWDRNGLYLLAEVKDDQFEQPFSGAEIWRGDSMQFAFDCGNDARPRSGYDGNDCEFGAAFGRSPWCWQAVAGFESGDAAGTARNGRDPRGRENPLPGPDFVERACAARTASRRNRRVQRGLSRPRRRCGELLCGPCRRDSLPSRIRRYSAASA